MYKKIFLLVCILTLLSTHNLKADEIGELKELILKQNQRIQQLLARVENLENKQKRQDKEIEKTVTRLVEDKQVSALPDSIKWVENVKWSGDLRYRHESLDDTDSGSDKRNRNRIRARLGLTAKVNDEWDLGFRLASGSSESPTSTNETLDNSFSSKEIWLDLAYADWHPGAYPGLNLFVGKMKNPFYRVGKNQLIWDGDVNPEGFAATYKFDMNKSTAATLTGAGFWMEERSGDADAGYFGTQAMLKHKLDGDRHLIGGASYYNIGNIEGKTTPSSVSLKGNTETSSGSGLYEYDFDILEGFAEYGWKWNGMPVAVFGNYVQNLAAPSDKNTGYTIGLNLNKAKKPGSWQFGYSYRDIESDAVFAGLNDSDFIDGGTDGQGHTFGYKYQLAKNLQAGLTLFLNDRKRSPDRNEKFERLQADLIFKF